MYTGDGKPAISVTADVSLPDASSSNPSAPPNIEPGTAVEVLELANGETIWYVRPPIDTQILINWRRISTIGPL
jgi:serine/arginine repetitive matrix protein 2